MMVKKTIAAVAVGALMSAGAAFAQNTSSGTDGLGDAGLDATTTFGELCASYNCSWLLRCTTDGLGFRVATADGGAYGDVWMANLIRPNGVLIQATSNQYSDGTALPVGVLGQPAEATGQEIFITWAAGNEIPAGLAASTWLQVQALGGGDPWLNCYYVWSDPYGGAPMPPVM